jgi:hypothetical protein
MVDLIFGIIPHAVILSQLHTLKVITKHGSVTLRTGKHWQKAILNEHGPHYEAQSRIMENIF